MLTSMRVLRWLVAGSLAISTLLLILWSRHWPLVGDAALIHYIGFLIERGWAPYRQLGDMNMPGSFLIEMTAMHVFGGGAAGWRAFDLTLLGVAGGAFFVVTRRAGWFAGAFAAGLFALVHGRDGLAEGGQRDLTMGVLLVASTALLMTGVRRRTWWAFVAFGIMAGVALTIKPTALPLSLTQLAIAWWALRRSDASAANRKTLLACMAMLAGPAAALVFLVREHAVAAFLHGLRTIVPYYASLGHRPFGFLLLHSVSPLLPLVIAWGLVLALGRQPWSWERAMLACGVLFGLVSYVVQARGLPYYRYPLLAFLLPLMAFDFTCALKWAHTSVTTERRWAGLAAVAALCIGGLFLGPQSALLAHRYRWWETDFIDSLETNLNRLGGPRLSGHIQCVDSISGCGATLYRMRLEPASGVLSDFLLFGPDDVPVILETRQAFSSAVYEQPPDVLVVSSWLHMDGPGDYQKLARWPEFSLFLASHYQLDTDWKPTRMTRWWSREELPAGYRIYVRKPDAH